MNRLSRSWIGALNQLVYSTPPPCVKIYSQINITDGKCAHHPFFGQPALHHLLAWRGSASGHGLEITGRDADLGSGSSCQPGGGPGTHPHEAGCSIESERGFVLVTGWSRTVQRRMVRLLTLPTPLVVVLGRVF